MSREWDASSYHKVSAPQTEWGRRVLSRLALNGNERAIDAGCGTGRLTGELLGRLPHGRVVAIDRSWNMLLTARANLRPDFGRQVSFIQVDLPRAALRFVGRPRVQHGDVPLGARSSGALPATSSAPCGRGGRLFAQCGGGPNLARAHALAESVMHREPFAQYFADWPGIWEFATAEETAERLRDAGFVDIRTNLEQAATTLADEASYREFVTTVIYNPHLARIPDPALRARFIDEVAALAAREDPPYTLDYWRLNWKGTGHEPPARHSACRARVVFGGEDGEEHDLRVATAAGWPERVRAGAAACPARACRHGQGLLGRSKARGCFCSRRASCRCVPAICWSRPTACRMVCATPAPRDCSSSPSWPRSEHRLMARIGRWIGVVVLAWLTWTFATAPIDGSDAGSFLHLPNLIFHEAGHVIFSPFGRFMTVARREPVSDPGAGHLRDRLRPSGNREPARGHWFSAAVCTWWAGQNLVDVAPYIADARKLQLTLIGGRTGGEVEGHDWEYLLTQLGWLHLDATLGRARAGDGHAGHARRARVGDA